MKRAEFLDRVQEAFETWLREWWPDADLSEEFMKEKGAKYTNPATDSLYRAYVAGAEWVTR